MSDGVQRLPTAYLLPIVARTENSALPLKGQLSDKNTSLLMAEEVTPIEQFRHIVAHPGAASLVA